MEYYLDAEIAKNSVHITRKIHDETAVKIWDILSEKGGRAQLQPNTIYRLVQLSYQRFNRLQNNPIIENNNSLLRGVRQLYSDIWSDSSKESKRQTWAARKRVNVSSGPPTGADLIILSTVASMANPRRIRLLTFDHDFIVFKDEILQTFNVEVENAGLIPDP